jgi:hypothetical protein
MLLKLRLDTETADKLCADALRELRPVDLQAVALLRRGLGLPVPYPTGADVRDPAREFVRCDA